MISREDQIRAAQAHEYVTGVITVTLDEVIDLNFAGFLDLISERLIGTDLLMDITYHAISAADDRLLIEVCGDPSTNVQDKLSAEEAI